MKPKFIQQRKYYKRRMLKQGVEATVHVILKPLHYWKVGLTFPQLCTKVREARQKRITDGRIRQALSMHNKFGSIYGIYIRCEFGWVDGKKSEKEWRYFVPEESEDINREYTKLENVKDISNLKKGNLNIYETKVLPQELQLNGLQEVANEN